MAYGDVTGLKQRAGVLAGAWLTGQPVDETALAAYLGASSAELDVAIGAQGFTVPVTDPTATAALAPIAEDMALLVAIDATWPGSSARDDVKDLRDSVQARVDAYEKAITDKNLSVLLYLGAQQSANQEGGAADFWTSDSLTYAWWERFVGTRWGFLGDPWGVANGYARPMTKDMSL